MRYDVIWHFIHQWRHKIIKNEIITSSLLTCSFYQKMSRYNVFQYETPDQMSYLKTLHESFENFQKIKLQWERIFEKLLTCSEFSLNFQSENGFELTKDGRIEMRGSFLSRAYFSFSYYLTPLATLGSVLFIFCYLLFLILLTVFFIRLG